MAEAEVWTVGRLLKWTADYLEKHDADSPRLDAEVLLAESLGCQRIDLYTRFEEPPNDAVRTAFRELVRRRAEGMPVAYLVGYREFYSMNFRVTPDVLIPRPETELLVVAATDLAKSRPDESLQICDVGTGSGILAICIAKHIPSAQVTAIDVSGPALAVAQENARAHGVDDRIQWHQSDLFDAVPDARYDLIVSNPPYVSEEEIEALAPDVREFEPRGALVAGKRGTEIIERLIPQAAERLNPGGRLLIELSPMIHDAVVELLHAERRLTPDETIKDLARHPRVVQAVAGDA